MLRWWTLLVALMLLILAAVAVNDWAGYRTAAANRAGAQAELEKLRRNAAERKKEVAMLASARAVARASEPKPAAPEAPGRSGRSAGSGRSMMDAIAAAKAAGVTVQIRGGIKPDGAPSQELIDFLHLNEEEQARVQASVAEIEKRMGDAFAESSTGKWDSETNFQIIVPPLHENQSFADQLAEQLANILGADRAAQLLAVEEATLYGRMYDFGNTATLFQVHRMPSTSSPALASQLFLVVVPDYAPGPRPVKSGLPSMMMYNRFLEGAYAEKFSWLGKFQSEFDQVKARGE